MCISKNDASTVDAAEGLGLVMPMYNLLEYSSNHSDSTGSLRFSLKDQAANFNANIVNNNGFKYF